MPPCSGKPNQSSHFPTFWLPHFLVFSCGSGRFSTHQLPVSEKKPLSQSLWTLQVCFPAVGALGLPLPLPSCHFLGAVTGHSACEKLGLLCWGDLLLALGELCLSPHSPPSMYLDFFFNHILFSSVFLAFLILWTHGGLRKRTLFGKAQHCGNSFGWAGGTFGWSKKAPFQWAEVASCQGQAVWWAGVAQTRPGVPRQAALWRDGTGFATGWNGRKEMQKYRKQQKLKPPNIPCYMCLGVFLSREITRMRTDKGLENIGSWKNVWKTRLSVLLKLT